jgi:hypothetical protein
MILSLEAPGLKKVLLLAQEVDEVLDLLELARRQPADLLDQLLPAAFSGGPSALTRSVIRSWEVAQACSRPKSGTVPPGGRSWCGKYSCDMICSSARQAAATVRKGIAMMTGISARRDLRRLPHSAAKRGEPAAGLSYLQKN